MNYTSIIPINTNLSDINTTAESTWTAVQNGFNVRKINDLLVQWTISTTTFPITANTHTTIVTAGNLPDKYRPLTLAQSGDVTVINSSGYNGNTTTIVITTNGEVAMSGTSAGGVGLRGGGIYSLI